MLNTTLDNHLKQFNDLVAQRILEDIYVDDLVTGAHNDEGAVSFYVSARSLIRPGVFTSRA